MVFSFLISKCAQVQRTTTKRRRRGDETKSCLLDSESNFLSLIHKENVEMAISRAAHFHGVSSKLIYRDRVYISCFFFFRHEDFTLYPWLTSERAMMLTKFTRQRLLSAIQAASILMQSRKCCRLEDFIFKLLFFHTP